VLSIPPDEAIEVFEKWMAFPQTDNLWQMMDFKVESGLETLVAPFRSPAMIA
jgi:hypothetical protein